MKVIKSGRNFIFSSPELPQYPPKISSKCQQFLDHCFQTNPKSRLTAKQLLETPFILCKLSTLYSKNLMIWLQESISRSSSPITPSNGKQWTLTSAKSNRKWMNRIKTSSKSEKTKSLTRFSRSDAQKLIFYCQKRFNEKKSQ